MCPRDTGCCPQGVPFTPSLRGCWLGASSAVSLLGCYCSTFSSSKWIHTLVCLWLASLMRCLSLPPSLLIYSRGCKVIAQLWGQAELHTQLCGCRWSQPTSTRMLQDKLLGWQRSLKRQTSQDRKPDGSNPYWGSQFWCRVF